MAKILGVIAIVLMILAAIGEFLTSGKPLLIGIAILLIICIIVFFVKAFKKE